MTQAMYEKDISIHLKRLNKAIKYVHDDEVPIRIPRLDYSSLRITSYSDAAFANNADLSSQLGRVVLLTDDNHNVISVSYKSYNSRQVACSVQSAKVIAFADQLDDALAIGKQLEFILRQPIPVQHTDGLQEHVRHYIERRSQERETNYA